MSEGEPPGGGAAMESRGLEDPRAPWEEHIEDAAAPRVLLAVMFTDIIVAALKAQERDFFSAADLWTDVDRAITEEAPFIPYATLLNATLVSPRVGNVQSNPLTGVLLTQMWLTDRK